jgi:hypothetical protein
MIVIKHSGNFNKTEKFFNRATTRSYMSILKRYGEQGVRALAMATPVDTGLTAQSWGYKVNVYRGAFTISWTNSNTPNGVPIAIVLQYGHATRNGGYVQGRDYINPTLRPIFDSMTQEVWKEITSL